VSLVGFQATNHRQQVARRGVCDRTNTRCTPDSVWQSIAAEFGPFDLDVAASAENARCSRFYTIDDDGLVQPWEGRVWCNPPFSNLGPWVEKATRESTRAARIVMLLPANRTEQRWWQTYIEPYRDRPGSTLTTRFLAGRLEFGPPAKDGKGSRPPFGCVLLVWEAA
jgi:phage N-6-adenine-methyltransferase